jgi:hypothetical protein
MTDLLKLSRSNFLNEIGINDPTIENFKIFFESKRNELKANGYKEENLNPQYLGAICLQELISKKLQNINVKKIKIDNEKIKSRLKFFTSDVFIEKFVNQLPSRSKKQDTLQTGSYKVFFNGLFNVAYDDWRDEKFSKKTNQFQCLKSSNMPTSTNINQQQSKGNIVCYLCKRKILDTEKTSQSTMECEHVLPIITALAHWWLVKESNYNKEEIKLLKLEYDWSHRCCNQIKSNYDFIVYSASNHKYIANIDVIKFVVDKIFESKNYDCADIKGEKKKDLYIEISRRIQPLIDHINKTLLSFNNYSEYMLLTKYKILSALTNEDFIAAIIGDDKVEEIPKSKAEIRKENEQNRKETEKLEQETMLKKRQLGQQTREERVSKRMRMEGGSFLTETNINIIIQNILHNEKYSPSQEEIINVYETVLLVKKHTRWNVDTGATHTRFSYLDTLGNNFRGKNTGFFPSHAAIKKLSPIIEDIESSPLSIESGFVDSDSKSITPLTKTHTNINTKTGSRHTRFIYPSKNKNKSKKAEKSTVRSIYKFLFTPLRQTLKNNKIIK